MPVSKSVSFAANPASVTIASGKTTSASVQLKVGQIEANSVITSIAISFTTTTSVQVRDSASKTKKSYASAGSYSYVITTDWKSLTDAAWVASSYDLIIKFGRGSTSGTTNVSNIRYDVYYDILATAVTPPSSLSLSASIVQTSAILSWQHGSDGESNALNGYQIQRRSSSTTSFDNVNWSDYLTIGKVTQCNVEPGGSRGNYTQYRIRSTGQAGQSVYSDYVIVESILRRNTLPKAPVISTTVPTVFQDEDITLKWSKPQDTTDSISGYKIYRAYGDSAEQLTAFQNVLQISSTSSSPSCVVSTPADRGKYVAYQVSAYDTFGAQGTKSASYVMRKNTAPVMPDEISTDVSLYVSGNVKITWGTATDDTDSVAGYALEYRHGNDNNMGSWQIVNAGNVNEYSMSLPYSEGELVQFRVKAKDTFNVYSYYTGLASVRIDESPITGESFDAVISKSVQADPYLYESGNIKLVWSESLSSYSTISYYKYGYAFSSDGSTYGEQTLSDEIYDQDITISFSVDDFQRGYKLRLKLYAYDAVGKSAQYQSVCYITRNKQDDPSLVYPASKVHYATPVLIISVGDALADIKRDLYIKSGELEKAIEDIGSVAKNIRIYIATIQDNSISMWVQDELGTVSNVVSESIECADPVWTREIESGDIIASTTISHRADLNQMLAQANVSRAAYGLPAKAFTKPMGYFANWIVNMKDIYDGIVQVYDMLGISYDDFPSYTNSYPRADIVGFVRRLIGGV